MSIPLPWLLLALGLVSAGLTVNALRPHRGTLLLVPSFFAAWWTTELALHGLIFQAALAIFLVLKGGFAGVGILGALLLAASWGGLLHIQRTSGAVDQAIRRALDEAGIDLGPSLRRYPRSHLVVPALMFWRRDIVVRRRVPFCDAVAGGGKPLFLDIYGPRDQDMSSETGTRRPAIIQVHGGAWVLGFKGYQGIPLLTHLAANGWVGFNVDYRLGPRATFPEPLIDIKRAIAWIRDHAEELGVDPDFIVITGGSAGGHLSALVALTAGDPEYQPDFPAADTSVQGAILFYGIYDLGDRLGNKGPGYLRLIERVLMKRRMTEDPAAFDRASPLERIHAGAPPTLVIHGARDNLAPVRDARTFAARLRERSKELALYAELPGAAHAFDVFPSKRTVAVIEAVERFLERLHSGHVRGVRGVRGVRAERPRSAKGADGKKI